MKRIFLTGCAGFIGQHLLADLLTDGHKVIGFDNLSSGRRRDIEHHFDNPNFRFVEGDVRSAEMVAVHMKDADTVWHLAANGDIPRGRSDVKWDFENNTRGTHNVLEAMRANAVPHIIFASTAAAYGDGAANRVALAETHGPLLPISLYAASKIAGEALISAYSHLFGIEAWIFRFANVVGGKMNHGLLFDTIAKLRKNPSEVEVWGDGKGEKPFFLVEDCIRGMKTAYRTERTKDCDIYNLGTDSYTTIEDAVKIVIEEMGLDDVRIKYTGGARGFPGDVAIVRFNPEKMNSAGWWAGMSDTAVRTAARRLIRDEP